MTAGITLGINTGVSTGVFPAIRSPRIRVRITIVALALSAAVTVVACGGGGGGGSGSSALPSTPADPNAPFSVTQTLPIAATPGGGTTTIALPSAGAFAGVITLPPPLVPVSATLTLTVQSSAPTADGVPALSFDRAPQGKRGTRAASANTTLIYIRLIASQVIQLPGTPAFSLTVAPANLVPGASYYIAGFDDAAHPHDWDLAWEGPATVNGTTLTFSTVGATFAFQANAKYWFALVATGAPVVVPTPTASPVPTALPTAPASPTATPSPLPSPSPTPSVVPTFVPTASPTAAPTAVPTATPTRTPTVTPTPVPTATAVPTGTPTPMPTASPTRVPVPTPTPVPTATPSPTPSPTAVPGPLTVSPSPTVYVYGSGSGYAQTVSVSEFAYPASRSFAETDTCSPGSGAIATIATSNPQGPAASYIVTGVKGGTCTATFTDAFAQSNTITIIVTLTRVTIQGGRW